MKSNQWNPVLPDKNTEAIAGVLRKKGLGNPDCTVILGSGLGYFSGVLQNVIRIPYTDIPGLPVPGVEGHNGTLHFGSLNGRKALVWSGRFHYYEGFSFQQTVLPVQISKVLGCNALVVTNAAGGIHERLRVGDMMLIDDLITLMVSLGPYPLNRLTIDDHIIDSVMHLSVRSGIPVSRGCYLYTRGPCYETKAEIRAYRRFGADAVGMSTAAELIEAARQNMSSLGISVITNQAAGLSNDKLNHKEVRNTSQSSKEDFNALLRQIICNDESPLSPRNAAD